MQSNGRQGQAQNGVDIVGAVDGTGAYGGVQCKGKDQAYGLALTVEELREEVTKAIGFIPPLKQFILATTAPNDAKIQKEARLITEEHRTNGLFSVAVMGWQEIQTRLADYPEVISKYFPEFARRELEGFELVDPNVSGDPNPQRFFLGWKPTFADLQANVDVRRTLRLGATEVPYEHFKDDIRRADGASHLYVVFGEGGTGKTTFLRRLALDFAVEGQRVHRALVGTTIRPSRVIDYAKQDPAMSTLLIIDDAHVAAKQLLDLNEELTLFPNKTLVVAGARRNEWNVGVRPIRESGFRSVQLALLSRAETETLIENLQRTDSLGQLASLSSAKRVEMLMVGARRQLLAGLLEATHGAGFREIIRNEYESINHDGARFLYAASCLMQRLGVLLRLPAAQAIALAPDRLSFEHEILTRLELVVQIEQAQFGTVLLPRHRNISNELVAQLCPTVPQQYDLALRSLQRLRGQRQANKLLQTTAIRVGQRMLAKSFISTADDAFTTAEAVLGAGTANYEWGMRLFTHALRPQAVGRGFRGVRMYQVPIGYPSQKQFLLAARILREHAGVDEAVQVLSEGLSIRDDWHLLTLALAKCRFDKGEIAAAESLVARVLDANKSHRFGPIRLPISLAMALMKFRESENPELALEYMQLAAGECVDGMSDPQGYFVARGKLLLSLGRTADAMRLFEEADSKVVAPKWMVATIQKEHGSLLAEHDEEGFYRWVENRFPGDAVKPPFIVKLRGVIAVRKRNLVGVNAVLAEHPGSSALVGQLARTSLRNGDIQGVRFLRDIFLPSVAVGSKAFCALAAPAVLQRDAVELRDILATVSEPSAAVKALMKYCAKSGDDAGWIFVRDIGREIGVAHVGPMEDLRIAVENGNVDTAKTIFDTLRNDRKFLDEYWATWRSADAALLEKAEEMLHWGVPLPKRAAKMLFAEAVTANDYQGAMRVLRRASDFREVIAAKYPDGAPEVLRQVLAKTGHGDLSEPTFAPAPYLLHYRAMGELLGVLQANVGDAQRGELTCHDGTVVQALWELPFTLQPSSLPRLWFGYPVALDDSATLHFQIVADRGERSSVRDGRFSIRGEIVTSGETDSNIEIRIRRNPPLLSSAPRSVHLFGTLPRMYTGWFAMLQAVRADDKLCLADWQPIIALNDLE